MKSKIDGFSLPLVVLLVSSQFVVAQGASRGNGAVAAIPGGVASGHEQGPALIWYPHRHVSTK